MFVFSTVVGEVVVISLIVMGIVAALIVILGRRKNLSVGKSGFVLSDSSTNDSYVIDSITGFIDKVDMDIRRKMYDETIAMPLPDALTEACQEMDHSEEFKYILGDILLEKLRRPLLAAISFNHICREVSVTGKNAYFESKGRQMKTLLSTLDKLISKKILHQSTEDFLKDWMVMVLQYSLGACSDKIEIYEKFVRRKDISEDCRSAIQRRITKNQEYHNLITGKKKDSLT
jgi:hypothetical protein